jgi:formiminoglutamase
MESVSAVNAFGFSSEQCFSFLKEYCHMLKKISSHHFPILGIYEYNPLFENLSVKGGRFLAGLLYEMIFD